ncbi:MAG: endonuclease dU [Candidatus Hodarchaeales archaeon]
MSESVRPWRSVKAKTPVVGIDDGGFDRFSNNIKIPVYGVIMKGAAYVDGIIQTEMDRDDNSSTQIIIDMISGSSHKAQIQAIFLQGITIAGFGIIDIKEVFQKTNIPNIVVLRKFPDYDDIFRALKKNFKDWESRWEKIRNAGEPHKVQSQPKLYLQTAGISIKDAVTLTKKCTAVGTIPEVVRIAHFIGASRYKFLSIS